MNENICLFMIDARAGVVYGDVAVVLDAVLQADFTEVSFAGSYED